MLNPQALDQLTGEFVRAQRDSRKLTRKVFSDMCGFPTTARLIAIETKDSWKPGEREKVMEVLTTLEREDVVAEPVATAPVSQNGQTDEYGVTDLIAAIE